MRSVEIEIRTGTARGFTDLTPACARFVSEAAGTGDGLLSVFVPHATAGIVVLELGAGSENDALHTLDRLLPRAERWTHRHGSPGHGADHVMPAFVAPSVTPSSCVSPAKSELVGGSGTDKCAVIWASCRSVSFRWPR